jgi:hypothetical protein
MTTGRTSQSSVIYNSGNGVGEIPCPHLLRGNEVRKRPPSVAKKIYLD